MLMLSVQYFLLYFLSYSSPAFVFNICYRSRYYSQKCNNLTKISVSNSTLTISDENIKATNVIQSLFNNVYLQ